MAAPDPDPTIADEAAAAATTKRNLIGRLAKSADLNLVTPDMLTITRRKAGAGIAYLHRNGQVICDAATRQRLASLAVPPAYINVFYAKDPRAHIQAIGQDAAGRLQYRYHPDWVQVREALKAQRLTHMIETLPEMRRAVARDLGGAKAGRRHVLAAAIRLVERTAIRAGNAVYEKASGSRGAATLRKRDVAIEGDTIHLAFNAKGGKQVEREIKEPRLARVLKSLLKLPGKRLFQFRDGDGRVRPITTADLNGYMKAAARRAISVKDFRTLVASSAAVETLAAIEPSGNERTRKRQINDAVKLVAEELANTLAVARKSYIHAGVIHAFGSGRLARLAKRIKSKRFSPKREQLLLRIVQAATGRRSAPPSSS